MAAIEGTDALFTYFPKVAAPHEMLPHIRPGHSLLIPVSSVAGLAVAVEAALMAPHGVAARSFGRLSRWSQARADTIANAVYFDGPAQADGGDGYRPARTFFVAVTDLRGLHVRLIAYLDAPEVR